MTARLTEMDKLVGETPLEALPDLLGELERLKSQVLIRLVSGQMARKDVADNEEQLLTIQQTAKRLNIPESRVYEMARQHELPSVRIGKYVRVPVQKLVEYERALLNMPKRH